MPQLVRRENAPSELGLSQLCYCTLVEVDVCVAPEPHGLVEGGANVSRMVMGSAAVGAVSVEGS